MEKEVIEKKLKFYNEKIVELKNQDLNAEVEKRLAEKRAEIESQILLERSQDIAKCENYIEVLEEVKNEIETQDEVEEFTTNEI